VVVEGVDEIDLIGTRKTVLAAVRKDPGCSLSDLERSLPVAMGTIRHHLTALEKCELIKREEKRFFCMEDVRHCDRRWISLLQRSTTRALILYLYYNDHVTTGWILNDFRLSPSTISYHLKRAENVGLIKSERSGKIKMYSLVDRDKVESFFIRYEHTFKDIVLDIVRTGIDIPLGALSRIRGSTE